MTLHIAFNKELLHVHDKEMGVIIMHAVLLSIKKEIFMRVVVIIVHNKEILMRLAIAYIAIIRKYYNEKVVLSGGVPTPAGISMLTM